MLPAPRPRGPRGPRYDPAVPPGDAPHRATADELAALDALTGDGSWDLDGRAIALRHLDKVLFPATASTKAVTKRDLVRYYATAGAAAVPFLRDRPVNVQRFPNGVTAAGFWQKQLPGHAPPWVRRWTNPGAKPGDSEVYAVVDDTPTLVWLGTQGVLELNGWTSTAAAPDAPTWALIDIDPGPETAWAEVLLLAQLFRRALDQLDVRAAAKTTGQRGLQVWVPVADGTSFDHTRAWVERLSRLVAAVVPDLVSWRWHVDQRRGRARLDYTQNARNRTLVTPWSPRPRPGAPVSVPVPWDLVDAAAEAGGAPLQFTVADLLAGGAPAVDPLTPLIGLQQTLPDLG